jgi:hypothetical protein
MLGFQVNLTAPVIGPTQVPPRVRPQTPAVARRFSQTSPLPVLVPGATAGAPPFSGQTVPLGLRQRRLPPPRKAQPPGHLPLPAPQTLMPLSFFVACPFRPRRWQPWLTRRGWKLTPGYIFPLPQEGDYSAAEPISTGAGAPFTGGIAISNVGWISSSGIAITFATSYGPTQFQYQLYAGRQLVGATVHTSDTQIIAQLIPSAWPQWLTLLAVPPGNRDTNYGPLLPPNPYNCVNLRFAAVGQPANAKWIEIAAGTVVGGAVNLSNVLGLIPFVGDEFYNWVSPPLPGTGTWNFQVAMRDDCPPNGNRGPAAAIAANVITLPPDVLSVQGKRLAVTVTGGVATATFAYQN